MMLHQILETVRSFDGVLILAPDASSGAPAIAWGDYFFYYAPDGRVPSGQPYGTIVTKDYPDDTRSALDGEGRWRVNVHVGRAAFQELIGREPREAAAEPDAFDVAATDVIVPHPVHGALGWVAVVNPGERTSGTVRALLRDAHDASRARALRRGGVAPREHS